MQALLSDSEHFAQQQHKQSAEQWLACQAVGAAQVADLVNMVSKA